MPPLGIPIFEPPARVSCPPSRGTANRRRSVAGAIVFALLLASPADGVSRQFGPGLPQFEAWRWAKFTTESGLPSNDITAIAETEGGTVWVGTASGLAWYDDYRWNTMDSSFGLPRRRIVGISPAGGESLYVFLEGMIYQGTKDGFRRVPLPFVEDAVMFENGDLLVYLDGALFRYRQGRLAPLASYPKIATGELHPLRRSRGGRIYLNARGGLFLWDHEAWKPVIAATASSRTTVSCLADAGGGARGYISVDLPIDLRGMWTWDRTEPPRLRESYRALNFMAIDFSPREDLLGVTTDGEPFWLTSGGLHRVNLNQSQIESIHFLRFRGNGSLWIGTADGLFYHNATVDRWRFWKHAVSDPHNNVNEILRTRDGSVWLATEGGVEIHTPDGTVVTMDNAGGARLQILTGLAEDNDGNVWVSSGAAIYGAYRWNGARWDHFDIGDAPQDTRFHKIRKDRQGRMWFLGLGGDFSRGTLAELPGAFMLSKGVFTRWGKPEGLLSGRVYAFAEGRDSSLWFGTLGGINRWKHGKWTYWTEDDGLLAANIFTLAADSAGRVWFGSQTPQLGYIANDSIHYLPPSEFPIHGEVWDLRVDGAGALWISGRNEIISYKDSTWLVYDASSGLGKFESWPVLPLEREVYVGTHGNGTAILNLRQTQPSFPRISIDKPVTENESVLLRWRPLASWGEISPSSIQSRFRIDGQPWSDWDVRSEVTLENLTPGPHALSVQAKGLLGNFGPGAQRVFTIAAPFYQQPSFFIPASISAVTIAGLGLMLVFRQRRHAADLRQSELKFRRLTEATFEGIALHDAGVIIDANQSVLEMFGYSYDEFVGKNVLDMAAPESRGLLREMTLAENEKPYEAAGLRKDGSLIYLEIIGKTIPYDRHPVSVIAIRDITERKQTEERLLMYQKQLQSLAQELSTTEEHERRQMATYLHDTIGQALAFCKIKLGQVKDGETSPELREVRKLIEETLQNAQSLTFELSPPILYELSFEEAVEWLCEHHQKGHAIEVAFTADEHSRRIPDDIRIILYNAVRELLVNIAKHSGARKASVIIQPGDRNLTIIVSDDGRGFAPSKNAAFSAHGGFGLFNIRERLAHLGGKLHIDSMPGRGTAVTISLPLQEPPPEQRENA